MADILIKGLDMPTKGNPLTVLIYPDGTATWKDHEYQAVPVPPHGRLIDQDAILREVIRGDYPNQWIDKDELLRLFRNAPTIIPASEVENG